MVESGQPYGRPVHKAVLPVLCTACLNPAGLEAAPEWRQPLAFCFVFNI